jgi:uncharacterized membrane protein
VNSEPQQQGENIMAGFATPPLPSTPGEFITALSHFHRAEIARMAGWRDRIDRTTNWAITGVGAMLSLSLSTATAHHGILLFAMLLVTLLLLIEARRYRFFDVYRARVRLLERNHFAQMFAPMNDINPAWARILGEDLRAPKFLISLRVALSRRLRRNYVWMFLLLLLAWLLKITSPKLQDVDARRDFVTSLYEIMHSADLGAIPGAAVILGVAVFYAWLAAVALRTAERTGELSYGDVHV